MMTTMYPDDRMTALIAVLAERDGPAGIREVEAALATCPKDPRLHFLKGSLLASAEDFVAARTAMRRALDLAPDYAVARFQLGLLLLSSGDPVAAQETWGPLHSLPSANPIRLFVEGLTRLIIDDFDEAVRLLEEGISKNQQLPEMNRDMQLVVDTIRSKRGSDGPSSPVDLLLKQSAFKATRH